MAQRVYQGHIYEQSAPGEPWVLVGPAQAGPQPVTIGKPDPHRAEVAQRDANQEARAAAEADRKAREWNATHEPDGSPKAVDGALSPEAIIFNAQQYFATGQMPTLGMGKQAASDREAILNEAAKQAGANGLHGQDLARQIAHYKAGSKALATLETQHATIGSSEQTALLNGQQFIDRSAELPAQTRYDWVNSVSNFAQRHGGGTTISAMDAAWNTFTTEYAKVVAGSPSGAGTLSDSARHEAQETMRSNASVEQKKAAFEQMKRDMANRMAAIETGINNSYAHLTETPGYTVPSTTSELELPKTEDDKNKAAVAAAVTGAASGPAPGSHGGPPSTPWDNNPGGQDQTAAMGDTRTVQHPEIRALVASMLNAGSSVGDINAELARRNATPITAEQYATAKTWMAAHPGKAYPINATQEVPLTAMQRAVDSPLASFGVKAVNAFDAGIPALLTGDRGKGTLEAMDAANPTASLLGDVGGSVAGALAAGWGAGKLAAKVANPTIAKWLANPKAIDTAFGAVSGASQADDPFKGAVIGAATGLGGNVLGSKVAKVAPRLFGVTKPADTLTGGERAVYDAANRTGVDNVTQALAQADSLGVPAALADVSPEVNSLTGAAIRRSPTVAGDARVQLADRGRGQYDRFLGAVERDLGPIENIPQRSEDLITAAKAEAGPLYERAYAAPGASSVKVDDLMQRPSFAEALKEASREAADEGVDPRSLGFDFNEAGDVVLGKTPSWQTLDYTKRGLDNIIERETSKIDGISPAGRRAVAMKNDLLKRMDAINGDYAAARAAYAGPAAERDALRRGQDALTMTPDQLGVNVGKASDTQVGQMRLGFQSEMGKKAGDYRLSTNPFDSVLGTPAMEQRLAALYPDGGDNIANLLLQRDLERQLAGSTNRLVGNSMTAERGVADRAFDGATLAGNIAQGAVETAITGAPVVTVLKSGIAGGVKQAVRDYRELGLGKKAVALADEVGPIALNTDPAAASAQITDMAQRDASYRAILDELLAEARIRGGHVGAGAATGVADALMR